MALLRRYPNLLERQILKYPHISLRQSVQINADYPFQPNIIIITVIDA